MKRILFISRSKLSHNLLKALFPLISKKTDLACLDALEDFFELPKREKPFKLVIIDWNGLSDLSDLKKQLEALRLHPLLKKGEWILIHPRNTNVKMELLRQEKCSGFYTKPFLPEEFIGIIEKHLGNRHG